MNLITRHTPEEIRWALAARWWLAGTPALQQLPKGLRMPPLAALGAALGLQDGPGVSARLFALLTPEEAVALVLAGAVFPDLPFLQGQDPAQATLDNPWGPGPSQGATEGMSPIRRRYWPAGSSGWVVEAP